MSLAGIVTGVVGAGVAVLQRSAREPLVTPQVAAALGLWAAAAGFAVRTDRPEVVAALAAVALLALAVAARALGIPLLAALLAFAGASWWLLLVLLGAERALEHRTVSELVGQRRRLAAGGRHRAAGRRGPPRAAPRPAGRSRAGRGRRPDGPAPAGPGQRQRRRPAGPRGRRAPAGRRRGGAVRRPAVAPRRRAARGGARAGRGRRSPRSRSPPPSTWSSRRPVRRGPRRGRDVPRPRATSTNATRRSSCWCRSPRP